MSDRDYILNGLRAGRGPLVIQRKDDPLLPVVMELAREGVVRYEVIQVEQPTGKMLVTLANAAPPREGSADPYDQKAEREREHMRVCLCGGTSYGPCFPHDKEGHLEHHHID